MAKGNNIHDEIKEQRKKLKDLSFSDKIGSKSISQSMFISSSKSKVLSSLNLPSSNFKNY